MPGSADRDRKAGRVHQPVRRLTKRSSRTDHRRLRPKPETTLRSKPSVPCPKSPWGHDGETFSQCQQILVSGDEVVSAGHFKRCQPVMILPGTLAG